MKEGDGLKEGDRIEVGFASFADLAYASEPKNVIRVEADSDVAIMAFTPENARLKMRLGGIYAKLKSLPGQFTFEVQTPTALAVVRGSEYRTRYQSAFGTRVYNFSDSPVTVTSLDAAGQPTGSPVTLANGEKTQVVKPGDSPSAPLSMTAEDRTQSEIAQLDFHRSEQQAERTPLEKAVSAKNEAERTLLEMVKAYEAEDRSAFFSHVSEEFPYRGEFDEFVRRDFRDYDGIKLDIYFKHTTPAKDGFSVRVDWDMQYFPVATSRVMLVHGDNLEFIFVLEEGRYKLKNMRGANPVFGGRSPEVAAQSGVRGSIVQVLEEIQDTGNRKSKQTALALVGSRSEPSDSDTVPVNSEIVRPESFEPATSTTRTAFYGVLPPPPVTLQLQLVVRLEDNPTNVNLYGVALQVTDSRTGEVLRGRGDLLANQDNILRTSDTLTLPAGPSVSGTYTFVIDPEEEFTFIDRARTRITQSYTT